MRPLVVTVLVLSLSTCCFKCGPEQKSYVDVPAKLDEVKKLSKPPDVVVEVVRQTKSTSAGGGGCGHSAACVILLPLIAWSMVFPEKFDEVTVTDHGEQTFHGLYSTSGDLLSARTKTPEGWRELAQIDLPALGQRAIVERAKVTVAADGTETKTPTTIDSQLDIAKVYGAALAKVTDERRADLLLEAFTHLDEEGDSFVLAQLSTKEDEVSRSAVISKSCNVTVSPERQVPLFKAAMTNPTPKVALAILQCSTSPDETVVKAVSVLAQTLCAKDATRTPFGFDGALSDAAKAEALRVAKECSPVDAALISLSFNLELPTAAYLAALDDAKGGRTVFEFTKPEQHTLLLAELARKKRTADVLERLSHSRSSFEAAEASTIIDVAFEQKRDDAGWALRGLCTQILRHSPYTLDTLKPKLAKVSGPDAKTAQVFLAVLGDNTTRDALANALDPKLAERVGSTPHTEDELVLHGLLACDCRKQALAAGKKAAACGW